MLTLLNIVFTILVIGCLVAFGFLLVDSFKRSVLWGLAVLLVPFATLFYAFKYWAEVKKPFLAYVGCNVLSLILLGYLFTKLGGMEAVNMAQKINEGTMTDQDAAQFMMGTLEGMEDLGMGGKEEFLAEIRKDPNLSEQEIEQFEQMFAEIEAAAAGQAMITDEEMALDVDASVESDMEEPHAAAEASALDILTGTKTQQQATAFGVPMPTYVESPIKEPPPRTYEKKSAGALTLSEVSHYIGDRVIVTTRSDISREAIIDEIKAKSIRFLQPTSGGSLSFELNHTEIKSMVLD